MYTKSETTTDNLGVTTVVKPGDSPKNNILTLSTFQPENFPTTEIWDIDKFLNLPPFAVQRNFERRAPKIAKILRDPETRNPNQFIVEVITFKDNAGKEVQQCLNGHTRGYNWKEGLAPKPKKVMVIHYKVKDLAEAKIIYDSIDSKYSVEGNPDKITGQYFYLGMDSKLSDSTLVRGGIVKALEFAGKTNPNIYDHLNVAETVSFFKDDILKLDSYMSSFYDQTLIAASLMMLNKYSHHKQILRALKCIKMGVGERIDIDTQALDGIGFLCNEWKTCAILGPRGTDGKRYPVQMDFVLFCMETWMKKLMIKPKGYSYKKQGLKTTTYNPDFW